jgi:hypothetical protein
VHLGDEEVPDLGPARLRVAETAWYTVQLWRMADGKDPDPRGHPVLNLARYAAAVGLQGLRRKHRAA